MVPAEHLAAIRQAFSTPDHGEGGCSWAATRGWVDARRAPLPKKAEIWLRRSSVSEKNRRCAAILNYFELKRYSFANGTVYIFNGSHKYSEFIAVLILTFIVKHPVRGVAKNDAVNFKIFSMYFLLRL